MSGFYLQDVLSEVSEEGDNGRAKFGDQYHLSDPEWLAVLAEELGEAATVVTQTSVPPVTDDRDRKAELRGELLQVAAVAARWIAALDDR